MTLAYYNEFDPIAAEWLRWLIAEGLIANGWVDERSIVDVQPEELEGYTQVHLFAGIGGWSLACRLGGWEDDRPIWTASCPCQPFSVAGKGRGIADERHLWPHVHRLLTARRPAVLVGEQVAGKAGYDWFDGIAADMAGEGYASRAVDIPACAVDAPHIRQRLYWCAVADSNAVRERQPQGSQSDERGRGLHSDAKFMADTDSSGRDGWSETPERSAQQRDAIERADGKLVNAESIGRGEGRPEHEFRSGRPTVAGADAQGDVGHPNGQRREEALREPGNSVTPARQGPTDCSQRTPGVGGFWSDHEWLTCHDGKARRTKPGLPLLAHGIPGRVAKWRGLGNAIVPPLAAEVIAALRETLN